MDYYVKVNIALTLVYGFYFLALRHSAYFAANRAFLLAGLGLAVIIPAFHLPVSNLSDIVPTVQSGSTAAIASSDVPGKVLLDTVSITAAGPGSWSLSVWEWIAILYTGIAGVFLLRIGFFLYRLSLLYRKNRVFKRRGCHLVQLKDPREQTFSFFSIIFVSAADTGRDNNWILRHELAHVRQLHSLDILLSEIVKALFWINPFAYLYQRALRTVNEYAADATIPQQAKDEYARLMYDYSFGKDAHILQNSFFNKNLLKRRINMLYQKKTPKMRAAYVLVLPLLAILLAFTSGKRNSPLIEEPGQSLLLTAKTSNPDKTRVTGTVTDLMNRKIAGVSIFVKGTKAGTATGLNGQFELRNIPSDAQLQFSMIGYETQTVALGNNTTVNIRLRRKSEVLDSMVLVSYAKAPGARKENAAPAPEEPSAEQGGTVYSFASLEKMPEFPGGKQELVRYISKHFNYPADASENQTEGVVEIGFIVDEEGNVSEPEILKGVGNGCDEEALQVVRSLPKWEPGEQNGVKVAVYYILPLTLRVE